MLPVQLRKHANPVKLRFAWSYKPYCESIKNKQAASAPCTDLNFTLI